jgi:hypothetical protein
MIQTTNHFLRFIIFKKIALDISHKSLNHSLIYFALVYERIL